jgi:hypothetical protein
MAKGNPIPFNPDMMPISQAKECADLLSMIFSAIEDGRATPEGVFHNLEQAREQMLEKYGAGK